MRHRIWRTHWQRCAHRLAEVLQINRTCWQRCAHKLKEVLQINRTCWQRIAHQSAEVLQIKACPCTCASQVQQLSCELVAADIESTPNSTITTASRAVGPSCYSEG